MRDANGGLAAYIWSDGTTTDIVSKMTLGPTGRIMNIEGNDYGEGDAIIVARNAGSTFEMQKGSEITGISHTCVLYPVNTSVTEPVTINGRVADCDSSNSGYLFRGFGAHTVFDKDSVIENNRSSSNGVIYSTNGVTFTFRGKIINNTASRTIYLIDHSGAPCYATIEDGTLISGNSSTAVYVNQNAHLTMTGGEISDNGTGVSLSGKDNQTFTMTGGKIIDNRSGGIDYSSMMPQTIVKVSGGLISGNGSNYQIIAGTGGLLKGPGESNDKEAHLELSTGILQGNATISSALGYLTLDDDYADIQLGSAAQSAVDKFKALLSVQQPTWSVAGSKALWFKPSEESLHFTVNRSSSIDKGRGLYVAYMPLQADGTPAADAALSELKPLANTDTLDVTLNGLQPGTSYALMFVMSDEYTLKPDDITVYTGGDGTDSSETNGLPAFSMNDSIPSIKSITVNGNTTEYNTWGDDADVAFARIFDMFEVAYLDENGKEITDDKTPGVYTAKLSLRSDAEITDIAQLKINGNTVKIADGELTIRFVSDPEDAADEKLTTIVQAQPLTEEMETPDAITNGQAVAVIENIGGTGYFDPSFYTNGSENAELTDVSGVSLFFDELLPPGVGDNTGIDRAQALEDKADTYLGDSIKYPAYEMKYLDLVDKNNGNAWVASDSDITIYWPYPEGTSAETEFRVLHFRGLHREYGAEYTEESLQQQIEESVIEEVTVTNTKHGVSFTLPGNETEGSFSPFALVWAGSEPDPGPGPDPDPTPDPGPAPGLELERGDHYAYIVGYEDDTIRPKNNITRAEVATIFFRLLTDESREAYFTTDQDFTDVNDSAWYANTVATLSNAGILAGYPDGSFRPNDPITRAEFAAIATRFDDLAAADSTFTDIDGHWAEDAINAAYGAGWVGGYPDGTFRPNNNITRAEVMSLVNRVLDREVDEDGMLDDMLTWTDNEPGTWYYEAVQEATNSHDYEREDVDSLETWTQINEPIDWDKVEDDLLNN